MAVSLDFQDITQKINNSLRDMLKFGPKTLVGIDIGLSAVKVAQVVEQMTNQDRFGISIS